MASYLSYRNVLLSNSTVIASTLNAGSVSYSTLTGSTMSTRGLNVSTLTGSTITVSTLSGSTINVSTLQGSTITVSTLTGSTIQGTTVFFSTMTASTILTAGSTINLARNVNVPNRFVEIGCDQADSMYLDFHSKDSALPDYSTRIISQGGATTGTGGLNMYASTIGLMATNGVGIGTTVPTAILSVLEAPVNGDVSRKNMFLGFRKETGGVQNAVSMALALGPNVNTGYPYGTLDIKLNGLPVIGNNYGTIPDITVMSIVGNGNVGIGTTVPTAALHIYGPSQTTLLSDNYILNVTSASSFNGNGSITVYSNSINLQAGDLTGMASPSRGAQLYIGGGYSINGAINHGQIIMYTGATERMRITSGGNVGIGTTNPSSALHVVGSNSIGTSAFVSFVNNGVGLNATGSDIVNSQITLGGYGPYIRAVQRNGMYTDGIRLDLCTNTGSNSATAVPRISILSGLEGGYVGIGTTAPGSKLQVVGGDIGLNDTYGIAFRMDISSYSNTTGASSIYASGVDALRFVGEADSNTQRTFTFGYHTSNNRTLAYNPRFYINSFNGTIYPGVDNSAQCGGTGNRWSAVYAVNGTIQTSDSNVKDATSLSYGINEILQMRTIKYKWKSQAELPDDSPEKNYEYYGFCADELAPIFPELVYNEDTKVPVQMNYSEIMPVMVNAIKEQNATIVSLQSQLVTQSSAIALLEARLAALEAK